METVWHWWKEFRIEVVVVALALVVVLVVVLVRAGGAEATQGVEFRALWLQSSPCSPDRCCQSTRPRLIWCLGDRELSWQRWWIQRIWAKASRYYIGENKALLLRHWYEIMALYYVKSVLTEITASRQDRRVLQKSKIIRIKFLSIWGILQTSRFV